EPDIGDALAGGVAQLVRLLDWSRIHLHIEATCAQHSGRLDSLIALPGIRENNEDVRRAFRSYLDSLLSDEPGEQTRQADRNPYAWQWTADKRTRQILIAPTRTDRA